MQAHLSEFRLTRMCRVLLVSRSGFYAWRGREPSARTQANQHLTERIRGLHQQTREAYGARKMWQLLNREGIQCGRHRVARLRRLAGIVTLRRRRYVRTVQARQQQDAGMIPNRLNQQFAVSAKNRVWVADYTFVPTRTGWLYVAVVLDLYSRRIVGWSMSLLAEADRHIRIPLHGHYRNAYLIKNSDAIDILGVFHGALNIDRYLL